MSAKLNQAIVSVLKAIEKGNIDLSVNQQTEGQSERSSSRPKSRVGKKTIAGHFEPVVAWQLRQLALDQQTTVQKLLDEALGDLFEKYHLPRG